jgi:hypothetical protein
MSQQEYVYTLTPSGFDNEVEHIVQENVSETMEPTVESLTAITKVSTELCERSCIQPCLRVINDAELIALSKVSMRNKTILEKQPIKDAKAKIARAKADLIKLNEVNVARAKAEKLAEKLAEAERIEAEKLAKEKAKEEANVRASMGIQSGDNLFEMLTNKNGDVYTYNLDNALSLSDNERFSEMFDAKAQTFIINRLNEAKEIVVNERTITQDNCDVVKYLNSSVMTASADDDINFVNASYKQKKFNGSVLCYRYNALHSLSGQCMLREIRHASFCNLYVDIDIVNCHPNIVKWVCQNIGINCDVITDYTDNRQKHIDDLLALNPKACKGDIKTLFIRMMYGCGEKASNFFDEECSLPVNHTEFSGSFRQRFKDISHQLCDKFKDVYELTKKYKDKMASKGVDSFGFKLKGYNYEGSTVSYICCFYENQLMLRVLEYLRVNHPKIVNNSILCFDGVMVFKGGKKPLSTEQIDTLISTVNKGLEAQGAGVFKFIVKPMSCELLDKLDYDEDEPIEEIKVDINAKKAEKDFETTFQSDATRNLLCNMLYKMGSDIDKFKEAITDSSFSYGEEWC